MLQSWAGDDELEVLWICIGILAGICVLVPGIAYVCYRMAFYRLNEVEQENVTFIHKYEQRMND